MNRIIFGGGFDPIHLGHINMALVARDTLKGEVIFVPAKVAIWKEESIDEEHKLAMLRLAVSKYEGFSIDTFELEQKEQPRSYQTVAYFKKKYPRDKLFFLIGQDQANAFNQWLNPEKIAKEAQIVYYKRPKFIVNQENVDRFKMIALEGPVVDIASSDVRALKSVAVPEEVLNYIEENNLYFISKVRSYIKESRFNHSLSVAHLAYRLAKKHQLDYQKAYIAGILHDLAKGIDKDESLAMMKQLYPEFLDIGAYAYHQFLGETLVKRDFNIQDEEILNAIKYHTTGRANMCWLEKLIYAADKIEPSRPFDSSDLIAAMEEDLNGGFLTVLKANYDYLKEHHKAIDNRLSDECFKQYLG
ncbi:MAG: nicotinate-nucleotide adenylyltransferase [Bacilli bacterium]|nr:nicotinate-nucleotide adenylyltransferase [Bacilli bacterium]